MVFPDGFDVIVESGDGFGVGQIYFALFVSLADDSEGVAAEVTVGIFQIAEFVDAQTCLKQDFQNGDIPIIQEVGGGSGIVICSFQYPVHFAEGQHLRKSFRFFDVEMDLEKGCGVDDFLVHQPVEKAFQGGDFSFYGRYFIIVVQYQDIFLKNCFCDGGSAAFVGMMYLQEVQKLAQIDLVGRYGQICKSFGTEAVMEIRVFLLFDGSVDLFTHDLFLLFCYKSFTSARKSIPWLKYPRFPDIMTI